MTAYTMGMAQGRCERPDGKPGPIVRGPVRIVDGEVIIEVGTAGQPGSVDLRGKPDADGTLVLSGFIMPGAGRGRGTKIRREIRRPSDRWPSDARQATRACCAVRSD